MTNNRQHQEIMISNKHVRFAEKIDYQEHILEVDNGDDNSEFFIEHNERKERRRLDVGGLVMRGYGVLLLDAFDDQADHVQKHLTVFAMLPDPVCARGLEHRVCKKLDQERKEWQAKCVRGVLEQESKMKSIKDRNKKWEAIAVVSRDASRKARRFARRMGKADEYVVQKGELKNLNLVTALVDEIMANKMAQSTNGKESIPRKSLSDRPLGAIKQVAKSMEHKTKKEQPKPSGTSQNFVKLWGSLKKVGSIEQKDEEASLSSSSSSSTSSSSTSSSSKENSGRRGVLSWLKKEIEKEMNDDSCDMDDSVRGIRQYITKRGSDASRTLATLDEGDQSFNESFGNIDFGSDVNAPPKFVPALSGPRPKMEKGGLPDLPPLSLIGMVTSARRRKNKESFVDEQQLPARPMEVWA